MTLGGNNTYSGGTTVNGGALTVSAGSNLGAASGALAVNNPNTGPGTAVLVTLNSAQTVGGLSGTIATPASGSNTAAINLNTSTAVLTDNQAAPGSYAGALTGPGGLVKAGAGTLALSGQNTYTGGTTLAAGTLAVNSAASLGFGRFVINGGTLDNTSPGPVVVSTNNFQNWNADFCFVGTQNLNLGTGAVILAADRRVTVQGGVLTVGGVISGNSGLTKAGPGTLVLIGGNPYGGGNQYGGGNPYGGGSQYTGGTTLLAGTLAINGPAALGFGRLVINGGTLDNTSPGPITLATNNAQTWNSDFSFTGTQNLDLGSGSVTLAGTRCRQVTVNSGVLTVDGSISGSYGLVKAGLGTLALSGASNYAGGTTVASGTLSISNNAALGRGDVTLSGGVLRLAGNPASIGSKSASADWNKAYAGLAMNNNLRLTADSTIDVTGCNRATMGNLTSTQSHTLQVTGGSTGANQPYTLTLGGVNLDGNPTFNVANNGTGTGTLVLGALGGGGAARTITKGGAGTLSLGAPANSLVAGTVVQIAAGRLVVVGSMGPSAMSVQGGVLENDGTIAGTTTIGSGALAQGTGLYGAVSLLSGGRFSPGNGVGTVTTGATTWNGGGRYELDLSDAAGAAGSGWDQWNITGGLSLAGTAGGSYTIDLQGPAGHFDNTSPHGWLIAAVTGGISGFDPAEFVVDPPGSVPLAGGHFGVSESGNSLYLDFVPDPPLGNLALTSMVQPMVSAAVATPGVHITATPEPSTLVLLAAGICVGAALALRRRRRRGARD
jgi:autotransporter-associated beta strand protein